MVHRRAAATTMGGERLCGQKDRRNRVSISLKKPKWLARGALALVAGGAFLASAAMPARAGMGPGNVLFGSYDSEPTKPLVTTSTDPADPALPVGDSILRLINPVGNANFAFGSVVNQCAMIYVFDNDEEMGACCGCPLTPADLQSFSFQHDLLSNWGLAGGVAGGDGVVVVRSGLINNLHCTSFAFPNKTDPECNGGCDPQIGFSVNGPLLGSITEAEQVDGTTNVLETPLFANASGDLTNNNFLIRQCAALVGNGSGTGICNCPDLD